MARGSSLKSEQIRKLDAIFQATKNDKFPYSSFMKQATKIATRTPSNNFYYDRKSGKNKITADSQVQQSSTSPRGSQDMKPVAETAGNPDGDEDGSSAPSENLDSQNAPSGPVRNLSDSDVSVGQSKAKEESGEIKEIYKNMLKEEMSDDKPSKMTISSSSSGGETETSTKITTSIPNKFAANPGNLLATIVKSIDNNLLYGENGIVGERRLTTDEEANIDAAAANLPLSAFEALNDPWLNFFIAGFAIPAFNRTDLIVQKVQERTRGFKGFKVPNPKSTQNISGLDKENMKNQSPKQDGIGFGQPETNAHVVETPAQNPVAPQAQKPIYNENQLAQIAQWNMIGFSIDPNYDFGNAIDPIAMQQKRIIRNFGSSFTG